MAGSVIFFCQRPVKNVIDIGTGTGKLLDHLERLLPQNAKSIWGVELFPPPAHQRTNSPHYIEGTIQTLAPIMFDAGLCMEVIEHLTPRWSVHVGRARPTFKRWRVLCLQHQAWPAS